MITESKAIGGPCVGECGGTGKLSIGPDEQCPALLEAWCAAERKQSTGGEGFHEVDCPDCKGTGRAG